jgi:hypothetical protein
MTISHIRNPKLSLVNKYHYLEENMKSENTSLWTTHAMYLVLHANKSIRFRLIKNANAYKAQIIGNFLRTWHHS